MRVLHCLVARTVLLVCLVGACGPHAARTPPAAPLPAARSSGPPQSGRASDAAARDAAEQVSAVADEYLAAWVERFPELGTNYGIPGARHDQLNDRSAAAERSWRASEDAFLGRLRNVDATGLAGHPEWVTYGLLRNALAASVAHRACNTRVWTVSPLIGLLPDYAALAQRQPVGSDALRAQALARWRALPSVVNVEIDNLREGVRLGYTESRVNVRRAIEQTERLLATPTEASPFFNPATRDSTPAFRSSLAEIVSSEITPAIRRYHDFLVHDYFPAAREAVTITANPNGAACYRGAIRRFTTLEVSPEEVHQLGLEIVAAAESTMRAIASQTYGTSDAHALMQRLSKDSTATFRTREEVGPALDTIVGRVMRAAPREFGILPRAALVVQPYPAFQELSVPLAQYFPPAEDGSRPGVFRVNLHLATARGGRLRMEGLAFHEGVPGHHFQLSIAHERAGVHPLTRYLFNSAFSEGWAIYAEHVADEMGLFSSDAQRLQWLEDGVYGGAALVMETGMHTMGWTRQQAIDYELAHTTRTPEQAAIDVDRRIGWPGQGLSYLVGYTEIRRLRREAEGQLGVKFDIKQFHDRVLEDGAVTLPMLREKIERWIAAT